MSVHDHMKNKTSVNCMVITISDTRNHDTDKSGTLMKELLEEAGHHVLIREIVTDEFDAIQKQIQAGCENPMIEVILTNGGTGIAKRDVTIEAIKPMLEKEITGFGEIFRMISYQEDIGSAAILSRAIAGVRNSTAIFATPGSSGAVRLAMKKIILPELSHVVREIKKDL
ncbi:molybdenum cofactor biosynthesis protein [Ornithinibacillus sp. L9]|uniref:Molybdenum cofactor biosynthesis protein B n=1 Tax=Ornithinibacillus caprae TaxID=2678566 RepID=A0A6N8FF42_9BACI|nr:molybdenum cofactor biosynthesis protein B [Ornithinibacillus caprae]MUK86844.1 molybdenum cofactor biosynthesis protein [Ornithinibacillus caprae]